MASSLIPHRAHWKINHLMALIQDQIHRARDRIWNGRDVEAPQDAPKGITQEIEDLIAPYRESDQKPPFSPQELVVMACAYHTYELSPQEILKWIIVSFRFYTNQLTVHHSGQMARMEDDRSYEEHSCIGDFLALLRVYDLPLGNKRLTTAAGASEPDTKLYRVLPNQARLFLAERLDPPSKGGTAVVSQQRLRFLDLPAEVRQMVYKLLFKFEGSGIIVAAHESRRKVTLRTNTLDIIRYSDDVCADPVNKLPGADVPKPSGLLNLLSTCRTIQRECSLVFYEENRFHFLDLDSLNHILPRMPAYAVGALRRVAVNLSGRRRFGDRGFGNTMVGFPAAVRALQDAGKLQKLEIYMHDEYKDWIKMDKLARSHLGWSKARTFRQIDDVPCSKELSAVATRVETVEISGNCPQLRAQVEKGKELVKKAKDGL